MGKDGIFSVCLSYFFRFSIHFIVNGQPYEKKEGKKMIPIWVYFVAAGIVISAYMAVRTGREEKKVEHDSIEREGEIYMKRLEQEKEERKSTKVSAG